MINVFIIVYHNTDSAIFSKKITVPKKSQKEIYIPLGDEKAHQDYMLSYIRSEGNTPKLVPVPGNNNPLTESFMIEQLLDTVWIVPFHVN